VTWGVSEGQWLPAPSGEGGSLTWTQDGLQLQLETSLPREQAVAIAASLAP
jgi:hypothetical protein